MEKQIQNTDSYTLRANGWLLWYFKILFFVIFVAAIYAYIKFSFSIWLLILYFLAFIGFYFWGYLIKLDISQKGISWKSGFSKIKFMAWENINDITMGIKNILIINSKDSNHNKFEINCFLLFNKIELAHALKLIFYYKPNITVDTKTSAFIKRGGKSTFYEVFLKKK